LALLLWLLCLQAGGRILLLLGLSLLLHTALGQLLLLVVCQQADVPPHVPGREQHITPGLQVVGTWKAAIQHL
jgi:hypothetical protein